jgi:Holliday junction resolvase RusA-like endonuclease
VSAFFLPIVPPTSTSQGKRMAIVAGRPMFFKKKKHQQAETDLLLLCKQYAPAAPELGPVSLQIEFVFPYRKTEKKRNLRFPKIPHTSKPDCDNMAKLVGDVLTKLKFYKDDSQVSQLVVSKYWGHKVGIGISIVPIALGVVEPKKAEPTELQLL